jgi:hypothetical protein
MELVEKKLINWNKFLAEENRPEKNKESIMKICAN